MVSDTAAAAAGSAGSSLVLFFRRAGALASGSTRPATGVRFTIALIALCAKMARADGAVTFDEVEAFRRIVQVVQQDEASVRRVFDLAKQDTAGFEEYARQIGESFVAEPQLRRDVFEALFVIAAADGVLHEKEDRFLAIVAGHLNIGPSEVAHIRSLFVRGATSPYEVLGLSPAATDAELKARHRQLVLEHHPDRMIGRGLPREMIAVANRKLAAINAAFDTIARERGCD